MKIFKIVLVIALPILIFLNLWRALNLGDDYTFKGFAFTFEYTSHYPAFEYTYNTWTALSGFYNPVALGVGLITGTAAIIQLLVCPIMLIGSLLGDLVRNLIWFFGWIFNMVA